MARIVARLAAIGTLWMLASAPAASPQLQSSPTLPARPAVQGTRAGAQANKPRPAAISSDPAQRPSAANPIPSAGPARQLVAAPAPKAVKPIAPIAPKRVRDILGRPIPGAVQVSPNRAYDPATGRYTQTLPATPPH